MVEFGDEGVLEPIDQHLGDDHEQHGLNVRPWPHRCQATYRSNGVKEAFAFHEALGKKGNVRSRHLDHVPYRDHAQHEAELKALDDVYQSATNHSLELTGTEDLKQVLLLKLLEHS